MERRDPEQRDPTRSERQELRETLIERQIREAMEDGRFDDLPHQGKRLPIQDDSAAGDWAMAFRMLRNAGVSPPWIAADKEVRRLLEARERLFVRARQAAPASSKRLRDELDRLVVDINRAIERVNAEAPTDRQHRRPLDRVKELARLDDELGIDR
jgi:Domain of unknown function (DUF1992)